MRRLAFALLLAPLPVLAHDYPTVALADYVLGCMAANGNTRLALERCACSIDAIAEQLPYDRYEAADTVLRMQAGNLGERGADFATRRRSARRWRRCVVHRPRQRCAASPD